MARAVPDPVDAALFTVAWKELAARLRQGEYPAEEADAWARELDKLAELERATRPSQR